MNTIALIGAPGAGKTRLAQEIKNELIRRDGQSDHCCTPVNVVDDYAKEVQHEGQYAIGLDGGYMASMSIAVKRYNNERYVAHRKADKTMIVCGTVIESSVYMMQKFERELALKVTDEQKIEEMQRIEGTVKMLAVLYMDTFAYDKAFYLPPLKPPTDERWSVFERNLQAAFSAYNAPVTPLLIEEYKDQEDLVHQQVEKVLDPVKVSS